MCFSAGLRFHEMLEPAQDRSLGSQIQKNKEKKKHFDASNRRNAAEK
jgi:hypothetical protein